MATKQRKGGRRANLRPPRMHVQIDPDPKRHAIIRATKDGVPSHQVLDAAMRAYSKPRGNLMRPPRFPLGCGETYSIVRGIVLFFHHNSWAIRYRSHGRRLQESLGTQNDRLAWAELRKATDEIVKGVSAQELIGARHYTTVTVAEAAKDFLADYREIALGTQRKLRGVMEQWVIGEAFDPDTAAWTTREDAALAREIGRLEIHTVRKQDVRAHLRRVRATVNRLGRRAAW